MAFSPDFLDEIRARLPISGVVGGRVQWDRKKSNPSRGDYWACCPFHGENTPSFHADDRRGRYHCFGCGVSGDIFTFLTQLDGLSFPEAVERLAGEAGVAMPARDPAAEAREKRRAGLHEIVEMACRFFETALASDDGGQARAYLKRRGFGANVQQRFRLGYAPPSRSALKAHLADKGVSQEDMIEAGLLVAGDDIPVSYDRFRERVIFPIADLRDRIVGFGGRALRDGQEPKYLNSPETPVFQKGALLYNAAPARTASRQTGTIVLVEGYADVIGLAAAGLDHAVAPLGTALTERQLVLLWRMADEPILCFDGDEAGRRAAHRAADLALAGLQPGKSLRFAFLPEGQDPDDIVRSSGRGAMEALLAAAEPLVDTLWNRETEGQNLDTPERRAALESRLRSLAEAVAEPSVRRHYQQAFVERFNARFAAAPTPPRTSERRDPARRSATPVISDRLRRSTLVAGRTAPPLRETVLVMTMIGHPGLLAERADEFAEIDLAHRELQELQAELLHRAGDGGDLTAADLRAALDSGRFGPILARFDAQLAAAGCWTVGPAAAESDAAEAWRQAAILHRKAGTLHKELKEAEAALAAEPSDANLARLVDIQAELANADGIAALIEDFGAPSGRRAAGL